MRAVLRGEHDGHYGPRLPRTNKLNPHKDYLRDRLERAGKIHLSATVLLREIRAIGYDGGITQLKEFVASIRTQAPIEPVIRFETAPGKQLQIDFVDFRHGPSPLRAFTAELGYSRYSFVEFTDNERTETLVACLERAIAFFGGVPEQLLSDNPKTIVIERNAYGEGQHRYNKYLLEIRKALWLGDQALRAVPSADEGQSRAFPSLFARVVLCSLAKRTIRISRCRDGESRSSHLAQQDRELPYAGQRAIVKRNSGISVPVPVESLLHPLAVYERLAREIAV